MEIFSSQALAVYGIIFSVLFGVLGLMVGLRRKKYPGEITLVEEISFNLFHDIVKNVNNLSILYKREEISNNIILSKGHFINTGTKDISPEMIGKHIEAKLPEGCRWLEAKITKSSPNFDIDVMILDNNTLTFNFGLFRCREGCSIEMLSEINDEYLTNNRIISWDHRIADTKEVRVINRPNMTDNQHKIVMSLIPLILIPFSIYWFFNAVKNFNTTYKYSPGYIIKNDNNEDVLVGIEVKDSENIIVKNEDGEFLQELKLTSFISNHKPVLTIKESHFNRWLFLLSPILIILLLSICTPLIFISFYKEKKFSKLIDLTNLKKKK